MKTRQALVGAGLLLAAWTMQPDGASAVDQAACPAMAGGGGLACEERMPDAPQAVRYADASLSDVEKTCRELVSKVLGVDPDEVSLSSSFVNDLGADDLAMVELVTAMEDRFEIEVPDEVGDRMLTFGDMVAVAAGRFVPPKGGSATIRSQTAARLHQRQLPQASTSGSAATAPAPSSATPPAPSSATPPAPALPDHTASIGLFGGDFCPKGTVEAAGQILTVDENQILFALLGTTYGGDRSKKTIALPDLRGKEPLPGMRYCIVVNGIFPSRP